MKKTILISVIALGLLSIGFMFGTLVTNGKSKEVNLSYENKIDSLNSEISDKDWQIDALEDGISCRESEISYLGRRCDSLLIK